MKFCRVASFPEELVVYFVKVEVFSTSTEQHCESHKSGRTKCEKRLITCSKQDKRQQPSV